MQLEKLYTLLDKKANEMLENRRYLHANPEISFHEENTSQFILKHYQGKDVKIEYPLGTHGIKVIIDSGKPGKTVALRADFDALPIKEETNLPFAATNGAMHACGHDGHTAYLLALADCLIELKSEFTGKIVILHQHAEEAPPGGAKEMIKAGCLTDVDAIFACHFMNMMESGKVFYHNGATQHARSKFIIKVQGKGGHASMPQDCNDAILIASQIVVNLQSIVSRRINSMESAVLTIGSFDGKGQANIIKDNVTLEGDVRCMSTQTNQLIETEIKRICAGFAQAYNCQIKVDYIVDYPVLYNDEKLTDFVRKTLESAQIPELKAVEDGGIQSPSEDFAYYALEKPASFFYIGAKPEDAEVYPHHHPKFKINESALMLAAKAVGTVAIKYLEENCECAPECNCEPECNCKSECNCKPECTCGDSCICEDTCNCATSCECDSECKCGENCTCEPNCHCEADDECQSDCACDSSCDC